MQGLASTLGFAAAGAQRAAALIHSQFGQVDLSKSKCCPCTEQDYGPLRAARSCPEVPQLPLGMDVPRGKAGKNFCSDEGRKGFPKDHSVSFVRSSKTHFKALLRNLVTAETTSDPR